MRGCVCVVGVSGERMRVVRERGCVVSVCDVGVGGEGMAVRAVVGVWWCVLCGCVRRACGW